MRKLAKLVYQGLLGNLVLGTRNDAGERLIDFCGDNSVFFANTFFQQHKRRLYTWTSPDGQHRTQIDNIIRNTRWKSAIQSVKILPGADCGTDHELLISKIRIKLKKLKKQAPPTRYDLNNIPLKYSIAVKNKFSALNMLECEPDELWTELREIVQSEAKNNIPQIRKKTSICLSAEAIQIAKERKRMKVAENI